jgi:NAD-dependent DNA ligase
MTSKKIFAQLSWKILEHKCHYYMFSRPIISDYQYDQLEQQYDALAEELGLPKSASDMVDFDVKRPACFEVYQKLLRQKKKK